MSESKILKLDDELIGQISKLLQVAILTGTDIIDHMRMMSIVEENGTLKLDETYKVNFNDNLMRMIDQIETMQKNVEDQGRENSESMDN